MRQEWGISTVIINKRSGACPHCAKFCGKVFIDDVWSGGKRSDGNYPLLSKAIEQGLYHPRCKDSHSTYFPELYEGEKPYTREEIEALEQGERREQNQQHAQRQAERYRRLEKHSLDPENQRKYKTRAEEWEAHHTDIGLPGPEPVNEPMPEKSVDAKILFAPSANAKEASHFAQTKLEIEETFFNKLDIKTVNAFTEAVTDGLNYAPEIGERMNFMGSTQQRNTKLRKELQKAFEIDLRAKHPGNTDRWYQSYAQIAAGEWILPVKSNNLATAFGGVKDPSWPNAEAVYNRFTGIGVNERFGADYTVFSEAVKKNVDSGYHPKGTDTVRAVFDHEIGHQLDYALGLRTNSDMLALYNNLSQEEIKTGLSRS